MMKTIIKNLFSLTLMTTSVLADLYSASKFSISGDAANLAYKCFAGGAQIGSPILFKNLSKDNKIVVHAAFYGNFDQANLGTYIASPEGFSKQGSVFIIDVNTPLLTKANRFFGYNPAQDPYSAIDKLRFLTQSTWTANRLQAVNAAQPTFDSAGVMALRNAVGPYVYNDPQQWTTIYNNRASSSIYINAYNAAYNTALNAYPAYQALANDAGKTLQQMLVNSDGTARPCQITGNDTGASYSALYYSYSNRVFGDPASGYAKYLIIVYSQNGALYTHTIGDYDGTVTTLGSSSAYQRRISTPAEALIAGLPTLTETQLKTSPSGYPSSLVKYLTGDQIYQLNKDQLSTEAVSNMDNKQVAYINISNIRDAALNGVLFYRQNLMTRNQVNSLWSIRDSGWFSDQTKSNITIMYNNYLSNPGLFLSSSQPYTPPTD